MKIVDVRGIPLTWRSSNPYMSAAGAQASRSALVVEIETDGGIVGIGEAGVGGGAPLVTQSVVEQLLKPMLVGEDPLLIERHWQKMFERTRAAGRRGVVMHAISGVDIALWDIAGKVAGLPLYRLFGAYTDALEVYASGGFYQEGKDVGALAAEAESYAAQGFRGMKMKIGRNRSTQSHLRGLLAMADKCVVEPEEDLARVAAVRKALGPKVKLMVDVNCVWSPAVAIAMGKALEPYDLYWIEEPVATDDVDGSAAVAAALHTPVAGYETETGLYGFRALIERRAVDIVQPDLAWTGGFSEGRRIAALAHAHNLTVAPHAFGGAVLLAASLHFAASIPNALVVELDRNENPLREALLKAPIAIDRHGMVALPTRPGLGIELDRAALERYRVQ
jgi:L-alanine-DL-glutamate epimerase-like enolase superfamily enzyme